MNTLHRITLSAAILLVSLCGAYGQSTIVSATTVQSPNNHSGTITIRMHAPPTFMPAIKGAPYSAEEVFDQSQTLADGTHITQRARVTKVFRDADGRTRTERTMFMGLGNAAGEVTVVEISDPVSGFRYVLDPGNHVAHRFAPPEKAAEAIHAAERTHTVNPRATSPGSPSNPNPASTQVNRPEHTTESLGSLVIEGVYAEGKKITTTLPIGLIGNDRPLVSVTESWFSPDLKVTVLSKTSDPRMGESTMQLRNTDRSEPDPALFQVAQETDAGAMSFLLAIVTGGAAAAGEFDTSRRKGV